MKKLLALFITLNFSHAALAEVWTYADVAKPIEQYSTQAKEEILAPIKAKKNFSGLTFVPETRSFYGIINKGNTIFEFDENFKLKREISISGFDDPEDLTFVKMTTTGPLFAISEEPGRILVGVIPAGTSLSAQTMKKLRLVDEAGRELVFNDNKGIEGISYLPQEERFVVVKEKSPMKMWTFNLADAEASAYVKVKNYLSTASEAAFNRLVTDLSAVSYNAKLKAMVFLSDESSKIIYVDHATKEITKIIDIKTKLQHEGLSFSADFETTYVGAEPYYLIRINKTNTIQGQSF